MPSQTIEAQQQQQQYNDTINLNTALSFIVCFSGLQVSFIVWGLMQGKDVECEIFKP